VVLLYVEHMEERVFLGVGGQGPVKKKKKSFSHEIFIVKFESFHLFLFPILLLWSFGSSQSNEIYHT
jgi:hypothetical protein